MTLLFVPPYLQVAGWDAGFGLQGWFPRWWFPDQAVAPLAGWRGAAFLQAVVAIPWVVLMVGLGLQHVPRELEDNARLDGHTAQVLWRVSLPLSAPLLLAAALWTLVLTAGEITITDVYQIRTFAEEIYTGFALGDGLADAQRRALPGSLLVGSLAIAVLWIGQTFASRRATSRQGRAGVFRLGAARWLATALLLLAVLVLLGVPLGNLVYKAGLVVQQSGPQRIRVWSMAKLLQTLAHSPQQFSQEFTWSMILGQLTALSTLVVACALAWYARGSRLVAAVGWTLAALGLAIPGPLLALGVGRLLNQPQSDWLFYLYDRTLLLPWLVLLLRSFPCAYLLATLAVRQIDPQLLAAAATDGAGRGLWLFRWLVPLLAPALGAIWLVGLSLALGDLSASILAVPPGVTTVAIRVFSLVHYGVEDQLAGLCLWTALLFGVLTVAAVKLLCYDRRSGGSVV